MNAKPKSRCHRCGKITQRLWYVEDDLLCGNCGDQLEARAMTAQEDAEYQKQFPEIYV